MKNKLTIFLTVMLLLVLACAAYYILKQYPEVQPIAAPTAKQSGNTTRVINPHLQKLLSEYEKVVIQLMNDTHTPGAAIAIVQDSSIIYLKGFGVRANGSRSKVDVNTVFRIASVSKCFASMLTGIMVDEKLLGWDDKIIQYLPEFCLKSPEQTANLSIKHVLSHTTGLPYHTFTNKVEEGIDINTLLGKLSEVNLNGNVGEIYSYQNVAYSLVGEVIKSASCKSYEEMMEEKIFKPLQMRNASISYDAIMHNSNIAKPHLLRNKKWKPVNITNTYYNVAPAGGINASIEDMAKWITALLGNRNDVITDQALDEIFTPRIKARSKNRNYGRMHRVNNSYYALGWRVLYFPNDTLIYHGGYVNGYRSEVAINRKEKIGICILANAPGEVADNGIPLFFTLYENKRDSIEAWNNRSIK